MPDVPETGPAQRRQAGLLRPVRPAGPSASSSMEAVRLLMADGPVVGAADTRTRGLEQSPRKLPRAASGVTVAAATCGAEVGAGGAVTPVPCVCVRSLKQPPQRTSADTPTALTS